LIRHILPKISPSPSCLSKDRKRIAKEGEFLPFVKEGRRDLASSVHTIIDSLVIYASFMELGK
jgi:hypothetical protein